MPFMNTGTLRGCFLYIFNELRIWVCWRTHSNWIHSCQRILCVSGVACPFERPHWQDPSAGVEVTSLDVSQPGELTPDLLMTSGGKGGGGRDNRKADNCGLTVVSELLPSSPLWTRASITATSTTRVIHLSLLCWILCEIGRSAVGFIEDLICLNRHGTNQNIGLKKNYTSITKVAENPPTNSPEYGSSVQSKSRNPSRISVLPGGQSGRIQSTWLNRKPSWTWLLWRLDPSPIGQASGPSDFFHTMAPPVAQAWCWRFH